MTSVLVPILYVVVLVGSLYLFSQFYRKRAAARLQKHPWWPTHHERDVYISLLQQTDPPAPDHILKAALLRRAVTDITRIHSMREDKQAATVLVQKGSVGDDLLARLLAAEKELETEILEVVGEANSFKDGWGSYIFQTASEMLANEKTRALYDSLPKLKAELAPKYGKKKRLQDIESSTSPTSPAQSIVIPAPSNTVPSTANKLIPALSVGSATGSDADGDESSSPTRTTAPRAKRGKRRK
ncbi:hypothetical protein K439DRAFT_266369 [Ramaria rubella]|nr:hypothetical protein K439DRAFT_266369 [Ramaria rubella]